MEFFSRVKLPKRKAAPSGSRYGKTYQMTIDKNGHKVLVEDGLTDNYEKIQSHLESTKIENIMQRAMMGDTSGLNQKQPLFMDFRNMPTTLAEAQNMIVKIEEEFNRLPLTVRQKFDHSPEKYIAMYGSEEWQAAMNIMQPKNTTAPISAETPKESEDKAE